VLIPKLFTEIRVYSREKALADVSAGVTVGVVALPLAMAFAIASGLPPERGLFTAIVAGFLISALGGSKVQIGGPTGAFVALVSSVTAQYGYSGLATCTLMAGVLLVLFGIFRIGALIKFIPFPVITGFTAGIAALIFSTQIKDLFGLRMEAVPAEFMDKWSAYLRGIDTVNPEAAAVGLGMVIILIAARRLKPKYPALLPAMIAATVIAQYLHMDVETIGARFGELPSALPSPALPPLTAALLATLIKPAFTIAMLAAIESLLSATVADGMIGGRYRPNIELVGQGVANIASSLFGGIPATGAIARTATNVKSGAKTPVAGMIHAVVLVLLLAFFAPWAKLIPLSALAGILVVVSFNMMEVRHFTSILKGPRSDAFVLILTFALTVLVDLTTAVAFGVVSASLLFIRQISEIVNVGMITRELRGDEDENEEPDPNAITTRSVPPGVEVFEINGPFFFGMIDTFKHTLRNVEKTPKAFVLRIRNVPMMDATGLHVLREFHHQCRRDGAYLIFSGVHSQPLVAFEKSGFLDEVGEDNFLGNIDDALNRSRVLLGLPEVSRPAPYVPTVARERL
jgi:SulP family sulfate permease